MKDGYKLSVLIQCHLHFIQKHASVIEALSEGILCKTKAVDLVATLRGVLLATSGRTLGCWLEACHVYAMPHLKNI